MKANKALQEIRALAYQLKDSATAEKEMAGDLNLKLNFFVGKEVAYSTIILAIEKRLYPKGVK